ncbi:MAG: dihydrofolate reductase family protein [Actinobacteria bacterium]|nr:dihydrofolate reductase family protein [Actinomycetota bacterium]
MRRIVNSTYISLDGVIESPQNWPSGRHEDDGRAQALQAELMDASEVLLMGRRTYEVFAPAWSTKSGDPVSDKFNAMEKWVASGTLTAPDWQNTTVLDGDAVATIRARKEGSGGDIVQFGFGELSYALMEQGLIDELRLWVHPFFVGEATPTDLLFRPGPETIFDLADATPLASGIVVLTYRK